MTRGNPMQAKCGAHCRTTGQPCKNACMPNGRCRMHGGKSSGRPIQHGYYASASIKDRQVIEQLDKEITSIFSHLISK